MCILWSRYEWISYSPGQRDGDRVWQDVKDDIRNSRPVAYDRQNFPYRYFIVLSIYWLYVPSLWSRAAFSFRRNEKRAFYKYSLMGYTMVILLSTLVLFLFDYLHYTLYILLCIVLETNSFFCKCKYDICVCVVCSTNVANYNVYIYSTIYI